jgi:hypothetical protein
LKNLVVASCGSSWMQRVQPPHRAATRNEPARRASHGISREASGGAHVSTVLSKKKVALALFFR